MQTSLNLRVYRRWIVLAVVAAVAAGALTAANPADRRTRPQALTVQPAVSEVRDEAGAAAEARRTGVRIEIPDRATERQSVYANPDGTYTSETHVEPQRVRRNGRWVPVDTTLVRLAGGRVGPRAAVVPMVFSGGGDGPLVTAERVGRVISLSWPSRLPAPVLHANTATYPDVLRDVDLVVSAEVTGYSHLLVVKSAAAMAHPALREITYGLTGERLRLRADGDGRLVALDAGTGQEMFSAAPPLMWDAGGRIARLGVRIDGARLRLTPDRSMLADPGLSYPVTVDPYLNNTSNSAYTMVDSGYANNSYYLWQNANNSTSQRIGQCPRDYDPNCNNSLIKRLYYELPTPYQDPRMTILDARFNVTLTHLENDWKVADVLLYRANDYFTSSTKWSNQPDGSELQERKSVDNSNFATSACQTGSTNISFSAMPAVTWAHNNGKGSVPFLLRADDEQDRRQAKRFCHDAVLAVTYNRAPLMPANPTVSTAGLCTTGVTSDAYALPVLSATSRDEDTGDAEPMVGEFTVRWTLSNGTPTSKTWVSGQTPNGVPFQYDLASGVGISTIPEGGIASWSVRGGDLDAAGNVLSWGPPTADCSFRLNTQAPTYGPHMESPEYMPDTVGRTDSQCGAAVDRDGAGNYGTFTFKAHPADTDIKKYYYGLGTNPVPSNVLTPSVDSGPVTLPWLPQEAGDYVVSVQAVDSLDRPGPITACHVLVGEGRPAVNVWPLDDAAGSAAAVDKIRGHSLTAGDPARVAFGEPGPTFGGPAAVRLTGESGSHLTTGQSALVNTGKPFSVSAWVKLDGLTTSQTVVSQDGVGVAGFVLGFDKPSGRWAFWAGTGDGVTFGRWQVLSEKPAQAGRWTHLLAGYDPVRKQLKLQVDVDPATVGAHRSTWRAHGPVQVGRRIDRAGYRDPLQGVVADVQLYDRLVPPVEGARLAAKRTAYWRLNTVVDPQAATKVSAEHGGGRSLTLRGGAAIYTYPEPNSDDPPPEEPPAPALVGAGHLILGGGSDDAITTAPIIGLTGSYSVSLRVRVATACTSGHNQAVISQPGANASRFIVRCGWTTNGPRWQLVLVYDDRTNAGQKVITDEIHTPDPNKSDGHLLAFTFNEYSGEARLYVDGQPSISGTQTFVPTWTGTTDGGLILGAAKPDGTGATPDHFSGLIDDVRIYSGVLSSEWITFLNSTQEQTGI
ncbi:MAG: LamG domain-containing protein [Hamadaea sp.]|nr:LamG domain-containing protein [Hamadaea sp.]